MFRTVAGITVGSEVGKFVNRLAVCVGFFFRWFDISRYFRRETLRLYSQWAVLLYIGRGHCGPRGVRMLMGASVKSDEGNRRNVCDSGQAPVHEQPLWCCDEVAHYPSRSPLADSKMSNHSQTTKCAMASGEGNTGE